LAKPKGETATKPRHIWAVDTEFILPDEKSVKEAAKRNGFSVTGEVLTVQFAECQNYDDKVFDKGPKQNVWCFYSADDFKKFVESKRKILSTVYGFVALCDIGSVYDWLGKKEVDVKYVGVQVRGTVKYRHCKFQVYDAQPLLHSFGYGKLADCGRFLGLPKLPKPTWLGNRKWQSNTEKLEFEAYAKRDAVITARMVAWLIQKQDADPKKLASAGTLAAHEFNFPRRLQKDRRDRRGKRVLVPGLEQLIRANTYAGHSDAFVTGYTPNVYYNDVTSLYPVAMAATRALQIQSVKVIDDPSEDDILDYTRPDIFSDTGEVLNFTQQLGESSKRPPFAWLDGIFDAYAESRWGLPTRRGDRTYYCAGEFTGLYHTFDLAAACAVPVFIKRIILPVYDKKQLKNHNLLSKKLMQRLEKRGEDVELRRIKAVLNATSGKLCQNKPAVVATTNFPAYSTLLAYSHLIMSHLLDSYPSAPLGMATDSIFGQTDFSGQKFTVSDGEQDYPVKLAKKGYGNLAMFRSGLYILKDENKPAELGVNPVYAAQAWKYQVEGYLKLYDGKLTALDTRMDVRRTLRTRNKEALAMKLGYWYNPKVHLDSKKLHRALQADNKRERKEKDSYKLVQQRRSERSEFWDTAQLENLNAAGG
jgi:hypothetical protein